MPSSSQQLRLEALLQVRVGAAQLLRKVFVLAAHRVQQVLRGLRLHVWLSAREPLDNSNSAPTQPAAARSRPTPSAGGAARGGLRRPQVFWCGGTGAGAAGCPTRPASTLGTTTDIPVGLKFRLDSNCVYIAWVIVSLSQQRGCVESRPALAKQHDDLVALDDR